ncbi:MAG: hypothetical protein BWY72_01218 [Bacteroidetes bacterium ADurb.Bin416]|nr:MAG: hypothetical protein BWY72_01218 [Bacteroidetes bacterium ADurb.Bin416]
MSDAIIADGSETRVTIDDFLKTAGGRITEKGGLHVCGQLFAYGGQRRNEVGRQGLGFFFYFGHLVGCQRFRIDTRGRGHSLLPGKIQTSLNLGT